MPAFENIGKLVILAWLSITLAQSIIGVMDPVDQKASQGAAIAGFVGLSAVVAYYVWMKVREGKLRLRIPRFSGGEFSGLSAASFY